MTHLYYRIKLTLLSPLSVGSGLFKRTDKDIARDSRGDPVIPGPTLAGIYKSHIKDKNVAEKLFGMIDGTKSAQSALYVYDANLIRSTAAAVSVRDSVALDEYKVSKKSAKFDFEILETGAEFVTYIEVYKRPDSDYCDVKIGEMLSALNSGELRLGSKTTRGFGRVKVGAEKKSFDLGEPSDIEKWLDFDMFGEDSWTNSVPVILTGTGDDTVITLQLRQKGGISIREYTTDIIKTTDKNARGSAPDYIQLTLKNPDETSAEPGTPVIPGTSWAGAFRHHYSFLGGDEDCKKDLFGDVPLDKKNKAAAVKSKITFGESRLSGGVWKIITRNAIDRFSAGTKEGALYTEKTYYNGSCELEIRIKHGTCKTGFSYIPASILDLHNGFLAVGGLTAVGRGLFEITSLKINGTAKTELLKNSDIGGILECIANG